MDPLSRGEVPIPTNILSCGTRHGRLCVLPPSHGTPGSPDGGFKSALRLSLSLLAEHIILGVFVNLDKTLPTVIPSRWMTHIGLMVDCRSCTWSLPDGGEGP